MVAPFHLRLQITDSDDAVTWCECRVGEKGGDGRLVKGHWDTYDRAMKRAHTLDGNPHAIEWFYRATFGERDGSNPQPQ